MLLLSRCPPRRSRLEDNISYYLRLRRTNSPSTLYNPLQHPSQLSALWLMSVTHDNERSTYDTCLQGVRPRATVFACMIPDLYPGSSHDRGTSRHRVPQERYWRAGPSPWRAKIPGVGKGLSE